MSRRLCVLALLAAAAPARAERVEEARFLRVGGVEQWVTIRGADRRNPILLILHGGPAEVQSVFASEYEPFERDLTVVQWDKRGAGRSLMRAGAAGQPTSVELLVDDAIDLTRTLTTMLPTTEVVLLGHSWGSYLGVLVVRRRPELYRAYVGTGQVVSWDRAATAQYRHALEQARADHKEDAVRALEKLGPLPPVDFEKYSAIRRYIFPTFAPADLAWIDTMGKLVRARLAGAPEVWKA